jgi:hypothetical protein
MFPAQPDAMKPRQRPARDILYTDRLRRHNLKTEVS